MKWEHLLGREFVHGKTDCYDMVRSFYRDNFGLELTNYARPDFWWKQGLNLYADNFAKEGFRVVDAAPHQAQLADVFLTAVQSSGVPNHAGIYLGQGRILHHFPGRFSEVVPLRGIWRDSLCAIIRHKDVSVSEPVEQIDIMDLILPHKRRQLDEIAPR